MNRAQQIVARIAEVDARLQELATALQKAGMAIPKGADFEEQIARLPFTREARIELEQERQSLLDERRKLEHEYDRLPDRLKRDAEEV